MIYLVVLVALIVRYRSLHRSYSKTNQRFEALVDDLYYQSSLIIHKLWDDLYDRENTIPLLFKHKTAEIARRKNANYYEHFDELFQEIQYIEELTQTSMTYEEDKLQEHKNITSTLARLQGHVRKTLVWRSLGVAHYFL